MLHTYNPVLCTKQTRTDCYPHRGGHPSPRTTFNSLGTCTQLVLRYLRRRIDRIPCREPLASSPAPRSPLPFAARPTRPTAHSAQEELSAALKQFSQLAGDCPIFHRMYQYCQVGRKAPTAACAGGGAGGGGGARALAVRLVPYASLHWALQHAPVHALNEGGTGHLTLPGLSWLQPQTSMRPPPASGQRLPLWNLLTIPSWPSRSDPRSTRGPPWAPPAA